MKTLWICILFCGAILLNVPSVFATDHFKLNSGQSYQGQNTKEQTPCSATFTQERSQIYVYYNWTSLELGLQNYDGRESQNSFIESHEGNQTFYTYQRGGRWTRECRYSADSCAEVATLIHFNEQGRLTQIEYLIDDVLIHSCMFN